MSEIADLLLQSTDPITAILMVVLVYYVRQIKEDLRRDIQTVRSRVNRLENSHIPENQQPSWIREYPHHSRTRDRDDCPDEE